MQSQYAEKTIINSNFLSDATCVAHHVKIAYILLHKHSTSGSVFSPHHHHTNTG